MKAQPDVVLGCQFPGGPPKRIGAGGVAHQQRPGTDTVLGCRGVMLKLALQVGDGLVGVLFVDIRFGWQVPHPLTNPSSDPDFLESVDDLVKETDGAGFEEGGGARLQHFGCRQLRRQTAPQRRCTWSTAGTAT